MKVILTGKAPGGYIEKMTITLDVEISHHVEDFGVALLMMGMTRDKLARMMGDIFLDFDCERDIVQISTDGNREIAAQ